LTTFFFSIILINTDCSDPAEKLCLFYILTNRKLFHCVNHNGLSTLLMGCILQPLNPPDGPFAHHPLIRRQRKLPSHRRFPHCSPQRFTFESLYDIVSTMAELGAAASVVGFISLSMQLAQGILQYYGSWKDQDSEIASMYASVDGLRRTLAVLCQVFQQHDPPGMSIEERVVESVKRVNIEMKKLEDELKKKECPKPGVQATLRRHVRRALYPFKEESLKKIQKAVSEARFDLDSVLQVLDM
jgi:hypothetical protein